MQQIGRVSVIVLTSTFAIAASAAVSQAVVTVDTCGQVFSGSGVLGADLNCIGYAGHAVVIEGSGSLDLSGFTLSGGSDDGVHCSGGCRVSSSSPGGAISGSGNDGVGAERDLVVEGVTLTLNGRLGAYTEMHATVTDSLVSHNGEGGLYAQTGARLEKSRVEENGGLGVGSFDQPTVVIGSIVRLNEGSGVVPDFSGARVIDSIVDQNGGAGIEADEGSVLIRRSEITHNGSDGIFDFEGNVVVLDSKVSGNGGAGVDASGNVMVRSSLIAENGYVGVSATEGFIEGTGFVSVVDSAVAWNGDVGVYAYRTARVRRSEVSSNAFDGINAQAISASRTLLRNNGYGAKCGRDFACADLHSTDQPRFRVREGVSECETSHVAESGMPGESWNVCVLD